MIYIVPTIIVLGMIIDDSFKLLPPSNDSL